MSHPPATPPDDSSAPAAAPAVSSEVPADTAQTWAAAPGTPPAAATAREPLSASGKLMTGTVIAGAIYGLAVRVLFDMSYFQLPAYQGVAGGMMLSFVFLVPLVIGVLTVLAGRGNAETGLAYALFMPWIPMMLFCAGTAVLLIEGAICIFIIAPIFCIMSSVGGVAAHFAHRYVSKRSGRAVPALLALPLVLGYIEKDYVPEPQWSRIERATEIAAPPARIWQLVNHPAGIRPDELREGLPYRIGVPYPIEGRTVEEKVGGVRKLVWEKGVHFEQHITAIEPGRRLCWTYHFEPDSFPPHALDDHVLVGGHYFDIGEACYTLMPSATGTKLAVSVNYRVSTNFNWYANVWGKLLMGSGAETMLAFYRKRGEAGMTAVAARATAP